MILFAPTARGQFVFPKRKNERFAADCAEPLVFFCLPVFRDGTFEELQGWWTGERFLNLTKETLLHVLKCVIALLAGADLYHVLNVVDEDFSVADMSCVENLLGGFNH